MLREKAWILFEKDRSDWEGEKGQQWVSESHLWQAGMGFASGMNPKQTGLQDIEPHAFLVSPTDVKLP